MVSWVLGSLVVLGTTAFVRPTNSPPTFGSESTVVRPPTTEELQTQLAERDAQLKDLRTRLDSLDEAKWFSEANLLGVTELMSKAGFTERQSRRVAVAIVREARAHSLDPLLVVALIRCESSSNPYAVSGPGAMGLMQVMPNTGRWLASQRGDSLRRATNLYDAELNIELGTAYLAELLAQFGTLEHALIAYNAGPAAARKIIARRETRRRFIEGYPTKVSRELLRLRSHVSEAVARAEIHSAKDT